MTQPIPELSEVAPTLADLKKLPQAQRDRLFLAKLAKLSRHDSNVLNKRNITIPNDPYGLAKGYPIQERRDVIEYLLGAPWAQLVNAGYLVDINGQGFHKVSSDGEALLSQPPAAVPADIIRHRTAELPAPTLGAPRVFISYSWDNEEHKRWVWKLAERLRGHGIDIILDHWHLKIGYDKTYFMEQAISQSVFIVIVCTEDYAIKANTRAGGVGYEALIITGELAKDALTDRFIPVLRQGTFDDSLPRYLSSRIGVDLRKDPYSEDAYGELLRQLHGEPIVAPPIGKKPDFTTESWRQDASPTVTETNAPNPVVEVQQLTSTEPVVQKPNASAWARYDKPGQPNSWISGIIRAWKNRYSFEIVQGNEIKSEEFFKTKNEVIARFLDFHRSILADNYVRMQFTPGSDQDFRAAII